ncbi:MAG: asparagine synthase-related protein [Pseudomonadota bacterium]
MSALAGLWNFGGKPQAGESCRRMLAAQEIYGPHDSAHRDDGAIAMGRRLFITLPEDNHDRQPLIGGDERFLLVADLRLDNRDELARDLGMPVADAALLSDADILLAAWERWEADTFDHLLGDYAFALWDKRDQALTLARDPMGARPLHYHLGSGFAAFASMPKGLHALSVIPCAPDEERTAEFLALMPEYGSRSFFKDIHRVEAGSVTIIRRDRTTSRRHWNPPRETLKLPGEGDYVEALRQHLDDAVRVRLRGAGNAVGAQLSGGLDSSAVAATAARLAPGGSRVLAFTSAPRSNYDGSGARGRIVDEADMAGATAALYTNMDHILVRSDGRSVIDDLDRHFFLFERPVLNACNHGWTAAINDQASERGVQVMLTGGLGNFTLSYDGWHLLPELAGRGDWLKLIREARATVRAGRASWAGIFARTLAPWMPQSIWNAVTRVRERDGINPNTYMAINPELRRRLDMEKRAKDQGFDLNYKPQRNAFDFRVQALRRVDAGAYNKGVLGGWGIDLRDPTADRRLVEFCLSLPTSVYFSDGMPRSIARKALADRLPPDVLANTVRGLQAADWHEGMTASRQRISEEIDRLENVPAAAAALDLARMRRLVDDWPTEGWHTAKTTAEYRLALLRGLVNGHFLRKALRSNA